MQTFGTHYIILTIMICVYLLFLLSLHNVINIVMHNGYTDF